MASGDFTLVVLDEQGVPYVAGTTTKVIEVVLHKEWTGATPEQLQRDLPHLTLAQIYGALAYYHAHKVELDADIERREQVVARLRADAGPSPVAARLRPAAKRR